MKGFTFTGMRGKMPKVWISVFPYKDAAAAKPLLSFDMSVVLLTQKACFCQLVLFRPISPIMQSTPKQKLHKRKAMSTKFRHCFESSSLFQHRCWRIVGLNFVDIKHVYKISETLTFWFFWHNWFTLWICRERYIMQSRDAIAIGVQNQVGKTMLSNLGGPCMLTWDVPNS